VARNFDAVNDKVALSTPTSSNFITASAGTLALWLRATSAGAAAGNVYTGSVAIADAGAFFGIFQAVVGGLDRIWAYNYDGSEDTAGATYTVGTWHHIVWRHSGGTLYLYKDGAEAATATSGNTTDLTNAMSIGGGGFAGSESWGGDLAEVAAWNVALTVSEIAALARGVSPLSLRYGAAGSLTAYLPLWGIHSPEPDFSHNRRTGTLTDTTRANHPPVSPFWLPPLVTQTQDIAAAAAASSARRLALLGVG
jgi:hypothetical protein